MFERRNYREGRKLVQLLLLKRDGARLAFHEALNAEHRAQTNAEQALHDVKDALSRWEALVHRRTLNPDLIYGANRELAGLNAATGEAKIALTEAQAETTGKRHDLALSEASLSAGERLRKRLQRVLEAKREERSMCEISDLIARGAP